MSDTVLATILTAFFTAAFTYLGVRAKQRSADRAAAAASEKDMLEIATNVVEQRAAQHAAELTQYREEMEKYRRAYSRISTKMGQLNVGVSRMHAAFESIDLHLKRFFEAHPDDPDLARSYLPSIYRDLDLLRETFEDLSEASEPISVEVPRSRLSAQLDTGEITPPKVS